MRRTTVALIPIVGSLLFAACSDNRDATAPPNLAASRSVTQNAPPSSSCSFSLIGQDANLYFPAGDAVFALISDMKQAYQTRNGGAPAATPKGLDILTRTAEVRRQALEIGDATAGGKFVSDLIACMDVGPVPTKFTPALALDKGVFEVRGNTGPTGPATAFGPGSQATSAASPLWGAEPKNGSWARAAATYGRYLVYGYPLGTDVQTSGFELGTLPASLSSFLASTDDAFRVGLCIHPANGSLTAANRLVHLGAIVTDPSSVLQQGTHFCVSNVASTGSTSWFASFLSRAASLFAPKPAFAQIGFDGIGGLPDGWSPFNPNSIAGSNVVLTFGALPKNVKDSTYFTLVVHASSPGIANVPGVRVTLSVANNSGTPAQAVLIPQGANAITQTNGDATFSIAIGKPGGYTLTATGDISGVTTAGFTSLVFNIKN